MWRRGSALRAMGCDELIVDSWGEYVDKVVWLAQGGPDVVVLREKLAQARTHAPMYDAARWTRNLELGLARVWERFMAGEDPEAIQIEETAYSTATDEAEVQERLKALRLDEYTDTLVEELRLALGLPRLDEH